jgi:hypothetical protein
MTLYIHLGEFTANTFANDKMTAGVPQPLQSL